MDTVKGYVYVITNKEKPELCKVGFTLKDPILRAKELETAGSVYPFEVSYQALVSNPKLVEKKAHQILKCHHVNKEWFKCSVNTCISAIKRSSDEIFYSDSKKVNTSSYKNKKEDANVKTKESIPSRHKLYFMNRIAAKAQAKPVTPKTELPKTPPPPSRHKQYFLKRLAEKQHAEAEAAIIVSQHSQNSSDSEKDVMPVTVVPLPKRPTPPSRHKQYFLNRLAEKEHEKLEKTPAEVHPCSDTESEIILTEIVESHIPHEKTQQTSQEKQTSGKTFWGWLLKLISALS